MMALRRWLAGGLGLAAAAPWSECLRALWLLPAGQLRPWPLPVRLLSAKLAPVLVRELEVRDPQRFGAWLAAFLLAPRGTPGVSAGIARFVNRLLRLTAPLWRPVHQRLVKINLAPVNTRIEAWADRSLMQRRWLPLILVGLAAPLFWLCVTTPLTGPQQSILLVAFWVAALLIWRIPGILPTLAIITLSLLATARYIWWRIENTLDFQTFGDALLGGGLLAAEMYTWVILLLGYLQNARPLGRKPAALPKDSTLWPTVDVFIPTYNEPLSVVKTTVFAALSLDWPADKFKVFILDDGKREEFRQFAAAVGAHHVVRPNSHHAKAGNLNHSLAQTDGEFVAIFDCDHVPVRSFLQMSMGWFLRDPKCALVQTPHHFFSPDPFERNLGTHHRVPNEDRLFYGVIQDGNDLWNATFFCGSCAIVRRKPLMQIGGIAVETVTEDAHTALRLHRLGYTSAYLNLPQAAGLATESLASHVKQRIRWARGMAQMFRIDNPLLGKGLSLFQRLCYANAMLHFFAGLPRLVFLTSPLAYLYFEFHIISAQALLFFIYVLPHLIQSSLANSRMQGRYRHSFWAEVYEAVLAWYITIPTTVALINPKLGTFNVTDKGGLVQSNYFDWMISKPYLGLILLNFGGIAIGIARLLWWNSYEWDTVLLNLVWALSNTLVLGAALGVAEEARQVRLAHRVTMRLPAQLVFEDGQRVDCETSDFSTSGLGLTIPLAVPLPEGPVQIVLSRGDRDFMFRGELGKRFGERVGLKFDALSLQAERKLVECTFSRADAWLNWNDGGGDHPLHSLREISSTSSRGLLALWHNVSTAVIRICKMAGRRPPAAALPEAV